MVFYKRIKASGRYYQAQRELRNAVLLRPIGVPDYSWEMHDEESFHFVALNGDEVVGCFVLYPVPSDPGAVQMMQMAVLDRFRGVGVGRELMNRCVEFARSEGFCRIVCHSRENAVGFYEKMGFVCTGEPFEEVGIIHRHMIFNLI